MVEFDWYGGMITRATPVTQRYRNPQNVRRFLRAECGEDFKSQEKPSKSMPQVAKPVGSARLTRASLLTSSSRTRSPNLRDKPEADNRITERGHKSSRASGRQR
jgi:Domain of unknown function (DUF6434)